MKTQLTHQKEDTNKEQLIALEKKMQKLESLMKDELDWEVYNHLVIDYNRLIDDSEKIEQNITPPSLTEEEIRERYFSIKKILQTLESLPNEPLNVKVYNYLSEDYDRLEQEYKKLPLRQLTGEDKEHLITIEKRMQKLNSLQRNLPNSPVYAYLKEDYNRLQEEHEKLTHYTPLPLTEEETKEHINSIKKRIQELNALPHTNLNLEVYTYLSEDFNRLKQEHKKIIQNLPNPLKDEENKKNLVFS